MVIGITGNSGAGKTTASTILAKKIEAELINADEIVRLEQEEGKEYSNEIINYLGDSILLENGKLNRKKLSEIIYGDPVKRKNINRITNKIIVPIIIEKIHKTKRKHIILDVPLLFESNLSKLCDETIAIIVNDKIKLKRLEKREKNSKETILRRLEIQPNDEFYLKNADYIIENDNDDLEKKVEEVWKKICLKHGKN